MTSSLTLIHERPSFCLCECMTAHLYKTFARMSQSFLRLTKMIVLGIPTGLPSDALFNLFKRDTRVLSFS
jgi:hypothetical protein